MPAHAHLPASENRFDLVGGRGRAATRHADIYRLTRNPMYLGIVLMLLGTALISGGLFFYLAALVMSAMRHP